MQINEIEALLQEAILERADFKPAFWPYYFEIIKDSQRLFYFGANHSPDPRNEQYPILEEKWNEFSSKINPEKTLIVNEGGKAALANSRDEAIMNDSEGGFITFLGSQIGITNICFELIHKELNTLLEEKYPRRFIIFSWFCTYADHWHRNELKKKISFEDRMNVFLEFEKEEMGWEDIEFTVSGMIKIYKELFSNKEFDFKNGDFFYEMARPNGRLITEYRENPFIINDISRNKTILRDVFIIKGIYDKWQKGYSMFIPFGSGHCIEQEPVLRRILK